MHIQSEGKWVHRPESAFSDKTKSMMTVLGVIFVIGVIIAVFYMKKLFTG